MVEDLSVAQAKEQSSLAGDVDALVLALDARAALEIGITQALGVSLTIEAEREALVDAAARVHAARSRHQRRRTCCATSAPTTRSTASSSACCATRSLFEIYNAMDLPELMRRVLEVAPPSIREVFDDHKGLTDALRSGDADATAAAITQHVNRVRTSLAEFVAQQEPEEAGAARGAA